VLADAEDLLCPLADLDRGLAVASDPGAEGWQAQVEASAEAIAIETVPGQDSVKIDNRRNHDRHCATDGYLTQDCG